MKSPALSLTILCLACGMMLAQQFDLAPDEIPAAAEETSDETLAEETVEPSQTAEDAEPDIESEADEDGVYADADAETEESEPSSEDEVMPLESEGESELASEGAEDIPDEPAVEQELVEQPTAPEPGLAVRVERLQSGEGVVDPASVKLRAPFPAKLLDEVPDGWRIEKSERAPAFTREVELAPGSGITLSVHPHVLVPEADGTAVFSVNEPGYDGELGYRQNATVGAILATSIRQLEDDSRHLGEAIDQLQQLLVSFPQPEPGPSDPSSTPRKR